LTQAQQEVRVWSRVPICRYYYRVSASGEWAESPPSAAVAVVAGAGRFLRGDCNADRTLDISDAVFTLLFLVGGGLEPSCPEACDTSDDAGRALDLTDAIHTLRFLFTDGPPPGFFPDCETSLENFPASACPDDR
jgi:hypothetical protein